MKNNLEINNYSADKLERFFKGQSQKRIVNFLQDFPEHTIAAIKLNPAIIKKIPNPSEEIQILAVSLMKELIFRIKNPTSDALIEACCQQPAYFCHLKNLSEDIVNKSIERFFIDYDEKKSHRKKNLLTVVLSKNNENNNLISQKSLMILIKNFTDPYFIKRIKEHPNWNESSASMILNEINKIS